MASVQEYGPTNDLDELGIAGFREECTRFLGSLKAVPADLNFDELVGCELSSYLSDEGFGGSFLSHLNNRFQMVAEGAQVSLLLS